MHWLELEDCNRKPCMIDLNKVSAITPSWVKDDHTVFYFPAFDGILEMYIKYEDACKLIKQQTGVYE